MPFKIFKGIYKELNSYNDINLFDKKVYLENNYLKAKRLIKNEIYVNEYSIINYLSILVSLKKNKILDYGGGYFNTYIKFKKSNFINQKIIYDNFECEDIFNHIKTKNLFQYLKKIKKNDSLRLFSNLSKLKKKYNIIHFGSVVEYIDDIQSCLKFLFKKTARPEFLVFSDVYLSDLSQDFYTVSNYYGIKHKYLIRSKKNFEKILKNNHYKIINIEKLILPVKGKLQFYDMSNLPKKNRIKCTYNYLFKKI